MGNIIIFAGTTTNERVVTWAIHRVVPAALVALCLWRIFGGLDPTVRFFDDFFYYLKAAQNWVDGAGSTFFPGEPTNGYHPLWFLWLSALYAVTGRNPAFFAGVDISVTILLIGFFFLFERFLQQVTGRRLPAAVGAAISAVVIAPFAAWGLEMALTVFLAAALLMHLTRRPPAEQSTGYAAVAGLLCALMTLARLDSIVLAPLLLAAIAPTWGWRRTLAAAAGAFPLGLYAWFNEVCYGHLTTTSMAAKSLGTYLPPNLHFISVDLPFPGANAMQLAAVVAVVVTLARRIENREARRIVLALAAAPVVQAVLQSVMSGWMMFCWYFYFENMLLGVAAALVAVELTRSPSRTKRVGVPAGVLTLAVLCATVTFEAQPLPVQGGISQAAHELRDFAEQHPGVYAMGDAAGTPAWLMAQPVVHLEGLMMSHGFLKFIREQRPLWTVFKRYEVNYYVAVRPEFTDDSGCRHYREPNSRQSSSRAPAMSMTICQQPVHDIRAGSYHMRIYRIDPATGLPD